VLSIYKLLMMFMKHFIKLVFNLYNYVVVSMKTKVDYYI